MNAIDFLIKEHNKVRSLFADMNDSNHRQETKKKIFETIHEELVRHEKMEQTVWYPQLKLNKEVSEKIKHLTTEEKSAKNFMDQLSKIKNSSEWENELKELQKDVEHHANEEEKHLFPQVKQLVEESELERIGKEMHHFKESYQAS